MGGLCVCFVVLICDFVVCLFWGGVIFGMFNCFFCVFFGGGCFFGLIFFFKKEKKKNMNLGGERSGKVLGDIGRGIRI